MAEEIVLPKSPRFQDLTGVRFGRLVVTEFRGFRSGRSLWMCVCNCGKSVTVNAGSLKSGSSKSCGCLNIEVRTKHGMSKSAEFKTWDGIIQRCNNPNYRQYKDYGGRGIRICDRWLDFQNFYDDVGSRPSPEHSIDRFPNNNGNYEPGNVRWATRKEQQRNMRSNVFLTCNGETYTLPEWSERTGIECETLRNRARRWGLVPDVVLRPLEAKHGRRR